MAPRKTTALPSYPLAHPNPWSGLDGTVYEPVVPAGRAIRRSSTEQFVAWTWRTHNRDVDPQEVTQEMAFAFADWCMSTSEPPDIRHDLISGRSPDWEPMWAATVELTENLGRPPTMLELYQHLPRDYVRSFVRPRENEQIAARSRIREFVRRFHVWIEQEPRGQETYERYVDAKNKRGFKPAIVPWDRIKIILRPRTSLTIRSVLGITRALRAVWNELGLAESNPWIAVTRASVSMVQKTPKKFEREATAIHLQRLLQSPDARTLDGARDLAVICASVFWGLRASEIVAIRRHDVVKMDDGIVRVRVPSSTGGPDRYILLTVRMRRVLERFTTLVQERESRAVGPMAKWAKRVLEPDAPLFPALFRWSSETMHLDAKKPLLVNAVYKILQAQQKKAPRPTEIRGFVAAMMRRLKIPRNEIGYLLGSKQNFSGRNARQEGVDQAVVILEGWLTQEAKLVW